MIEYRLRIDENHVIEGLQRRRQVEKGRVLRMAVKLVCALGLMALLLSVVIAAFQHPLEKPLLGFFLALMPATFLVLLAFGPKIDYWFMKRRLRRSPFYGDELQINVGESGVTLKNPHTRSELSWAAFTRVHFLPDGVLVFAGPSQYQWWPSTALVAGRLSEVEHVVRRHVAIAQ